MVVRVALAPTQVAQSLDRQVNVPATPHLLQPSSTNADLEQTKHRAAACLASRVLPSASTHRLVHCQNIAYNATPDNLEYLPISLYLRPNSPLAQTVQSNPPSPYRLPSLRLDLTYRTLDQQQHRKILILLTKSSEGFLASHPIEADSLLE